MRLASHMTFVSPSAMDSARRFWHVQGVGNDDSATPLPATDREFVLLRAALTRYFRARVRNASEIDDLVQEVFTRIAARQDGGAVEHLNRYIFQTASSVLADRARRQRARRAELHVEFDPDRHSGVEFDAHRTLSDREELGAVTACLLGMPERTRNIFILHRLEGSKYRDIAVQLGISVSAVEKHMARAVLHLAANFRGHD